MPASSNTSPQPRRPRPGFVTYGYTEGTPFGNGFNMTVDGSSIYQQEYNTVVSWDALEGVKKEKKPTKAKMKKDALKFLKKRADDDLVADGIGQTVMALRERLMKYFKGSCGTEMFRHVNVSLNESGTRGRFYYERREYDNRRERKLILNGDVIGVIAREPDTIMFFPGVLNRSQEYNAVYTQLKQFLDKYLMGVEYKEDTGHTANVVATNGSNDRGTMKELAESYNGDQDQERNSLPNVDEYLDHLRRMGIRVG